MQMFNEKRFMMLSSDVSLPCRPVIRYGEKHCAQASICARFNRTGTQIVALRRRLPPVLYDTHSSKPVCQVTYFFTLIYMNDWEELNNGLYATKGWELNCL